MATPKKKIYMLTLYNHVTYDDINLTRGHQKLRRLLRSITDTVNAASSALFQLDTTTLHGEASDDKVLSLTIL